jgi:hypothetical protein
MPTITMSPIPNTQTLDVNAIRTDFPILKRRVHGKTLAEVEATPSDAILEILGREIAGTRLKCAMLGLNAVKEAVRMLRREAHLQPRFSAILPVLDGKQYLGGTLQREEIYDDAGQENIA